MEIQTQITLFECCLGREHRTKKMTGDTLFVVWHLMPASCLMSEHSEMEITLQRTLEGLKYSFYAHLFPNSAPLLSLSSKIISLHAEIKCVYFDISTQAVEWIEEALWEAEMRFLLFSTWTSLLFNVRSKLSRAIRIHEINTVKLEYSVQWQRWKIHRDISGLCFLRSLVQPQHECRCAAWQLVFMPLKLVDTWQNWKSQHFQGAAEKVICKCGVVFAVSIDIKGCYIWFFKHIESLNIKAK